MDNAPIFVKIKEYKDILKVVDSINDKVDSIKTSLEDLKRIKDKEDAHIESWTSQLNTVSKKMGFVNDTLKEM